MPSLHYQRGIRKKQRRARNKIKRKVQCALLLTAFVISLCIAAYQHISPITATNTNINTPSGSSRHLLSREFDDGYYINSLEEFPPLLFSLEQVRNGAWILNFFGMLYCFLGIAIICDDYFVPAIEVIVERLRLSEDVAGATFLAAGGSAPELFTSFVGTFVAESDVGFGTIVGSAVFNVLFIIGACAIFTSGKLKLQWYPFARDMSYYLICLGVLALFFGGVSQNQMYWWESLVLLSMYILYVFMMSRNERIRAWFYRKFVDDADQLGKLLESPHSPDNGAGYGTEISMQEKRPKVTQHESDDFDGNDGGVPTVRDASDTADNDDDSDDDDEGPDLSWPDTCLGRIWWIIKAPLSVPIYYTLMDVSQEQYADWWPWTFFGSLFWLGALAYLMVWWCVVVGYAWKVPQEVMGLVFLAAGTSVPELFSCIIVAKQGKADMAVSASIGSNIFDVLVGLPLPWLSYSIAYGVDAGDLRIDVQAHGLFLSILVLILMLSGLLVIILVNRWVLTHCMGYSMIALYVLFVAQDLLRHYYLDIEF